MVPFYETRKEAITVFRSININFMPHLHSQIEILVMEKGKLQNTVNGVTKVLESGDIAVIFPNNVHSYKTIKEEGGSSCRIYIIDLSLITDFKNVLLNKHPKNPFYTQNEIYKDVGYALNMLAEEFVYQKSNPIRTFVCKAYAEIIISRLLEKHELIDNTDTDFSDITYRTIHFINENYTRPLALNDLSKALGVGKYSLSRVFSEKIKVSFNDYINAIRASYAKNILINSEKSITEIAYDCGFGSIRTFNRVFKNIYKETPREFRKNKK